MQTETIILPGIGTFELDFELEGGSPADGLFGTYIDIQAVRLACDSHAHEMGEQFVETFGVHLQTFLRQKLRENRQEFLEEATSGLLDVEKELGRRRPL